MKILAIDHIGIAVRSLPESLRIWHEALGFDYAGSETVDEQKVVTAFFPAGESEVELLEPTATDSPIAHFLDKQGEGIHHIAFRVENLDQALAELKKKGIRLIDQTPRWGAGGARIIFIHPKATGGVLIELTERTDATP